MRRRCYNSTTSGEGNGLRRLGTFNEIGFQRDVQGEAMRKEQPDWHLRRWPYDQPQWIPKQLIGLTIINLGVAAGMFWSDAAFSVQWGCFKNEGSAIILFRFCNETLKRPR